MFKPCNHILTLDVLLRDSLIKGYIDTWIQWIHSKIHGHGYIQGYMDTFKNTLIHTWMNIGYILHRLMMR